MIGLFQNFAFHLVRGVTITMLVTLWMSNKWVSTFPSFNELLKDEDMVDPRLELSHGVVNSGDGHSYRRSHSVTELSMAT